MLECILKYQLCLFRLLINFQTDWSLFGILHAWMVFLHCGFLSASSKFQNDWSLSGTLHTWMFFILPVVLWVLRWLFKFPDQPKLVWHTSHLNVFSPLWILCCCFKYSDWMELAWHTSHLNCNILWCVLRWLFKFSARHLKSFKCPDLLKLWFVYFIFCLFILV